MSVSFDLCEVAQSYPRKRAQQKELPADQQEEFRRQHAKHAATYRARHRLRLLMNELGRRHYLNPPALCRVAHLKKPEEYSEEDLYWVEMGKSSKRKLQLQQRRGLTEIEVDDSVEDR